MNHYYILFYNLWFYHWFYHRTSRTHRNPPESTNHRSLMPLWARWVLPPLQHSAGPQTYRGAPGEAVRHRNVSGHVLEKFRWKHGTKTIKNQGISPGNSWKKPSKIGKTWKINGQTQSWRPKRSRRIPTFSPPTELSWFISPISLLAFW